jgi:proteasome beta subunit
MSVNEAITLAIRLLMTASEFDSATGGVNPERDMFATIKLLTRDGIRTVDMKEQERCWKDKAR